MANLGVFLLAGPLDEIYVTDISVVSHSRPADMSAKLDRFVILPVWAPWAIMGRALMGQAFMALGPSTASWAGPLWAGPYGHPWAMGWGERREGGYYERNSVSISLMNSSCGK